MTEPQTTEIIRNGLWSNNPALVQLLGLCPLLAVTSTVVNAVGLGLATLLVVTSSNIAVSLIRNFVTESVRLPAFVMIIASLVTCTELLMKAYAYEALSDPRHLHPVDRHQLRHPRPCRSLRQQKPHPPLRPWTD